MKKSISLGLIAVSLTGNLASWASDPTPAASTGDKIRDPKTCQVTHKKTKAVVQAICGYKKNPEGVEVKYRTFTDTATGHIIEQFDQKDGKIKTVVRNQIPASKVAEAPKKTAQTTTSVSTTTQSSRVVHRNPIDNGDATRYLIIGAAIVSVATLGIIAAHSHYSRGKAAGMEEAARVSTRASALSSRPTELSGMPENITLGKDVPKSSGKNVRVAGAVPSRSIPENVPRFRTASGDVYIIQQNPNTSLLETLILYDYLTTPWYYPYRGWHYYDSFMYSPYAYSSGYGSDLIVNETIVNNTTVYADTTNTNVYEGSAAPADVGGAGDFGGDFSNSPVAGDVLDTTFETPAASDWSSGFDSSGSGGADFFSGSDSSIDFGA